MRYVIILEQGSEGWGAYAPDIPGCVAAGETREETLLLMREAIEFHLEGLRENGEPIPEPKSSSELVEIKAA
jgi:predicted RNase H-like HicB family nuclease